MLGGPGQDNIALTRWQGYKQGFVTMYIWNSNEVLL